MFSTNERLQAMLNDALGPFILNALSNPYTTEIMVNPNGSVWQEQLGQPMLHRGFMSAMHAENIIRLVTSLNDQEINSTSPAIAAVLPGGQRFQGFLPPMSDAPCFTIRCPQLRILTMNDYVPLFCSERTWSIITGYVVARKNILIVGGMSSGKSTLMNSLISYIPPEERIVTIEDTPELRITLPNHVRLYTSRYLPMHATVAEALRGRFDRILPGEIRDGATAIGVLSAWNIGHPGGLCTLHANSAYEALYRLEDLCSEVNAAGDYRPRIGRTIDLIVYLARVNGQRVISDVLTINGWNGDSYDTKSLLERDN